MKGRPKIAAVSFKGGLRIFLRLQKEVGVALAYNAVHAPRPKDSRAVAARDISGWHSSDDRAAIDLITKYGEQAMGFFTAEEAAVLSVEKMSFQIVGEEHFTPRPPMKDVEHADFFLARLRDVDVAAIYRFDSTSKTKKILEDVASGTKSFVKGSDELTRDFHKQHVGQSTHGAFFIFELSGGDPSTILYAMLKYDYRPVLAPAKAGKPKQLRKILEALVQDKKALQKSCLVRVVNGAAETAVSARDRAARSPSITDFFARFLDVERDRTDEELNKAAADVLLNVIKTSEDLIPKSGQGNALRAAREHLRLAPAINDDEVLRAVVIAAGSPVDDDVLQILEKRTRRFMKSHRIYGLEFQPDSLVLKNSARRKIRTIEGIRIEYPEQLEGQRVMTVDNPDGSAVITIKTQHLERFDLVPESASAVD